MKTVKTRIWAGTLLLMLSVGLAGCLKDTPEPGREVIYEFAGTKTFEVASEKGVYASVLGYPYPATMLRESSSGNWFAHNVIGFDDYEPGYEYTIEVDSYVATYVPESLSVDGPLDYYELNEVVSKRRTDTGDIEWSLPVYYDLWPGRIGTEPDVPNGELLVIRTEAEFEALTGYPIWGFMDGFFDRYSILVTSGTHGAGVRYISKQLTYKGRGNYLLTVELRTADTAQLTPWKFALAVPAIPVGANIEMQVTAKK
jgi:hypothetical protein